MEGYGRVDIVEEVGTGKSNGRKQKHFYSLAGKEKGVRVRSSRLISRYPYSFITVQFNILFLALALTEGLSILFCKM